jgi:hypothetical protein
MPPMPPEPPFAPGAFAGQSPWEHGPPVELIGVLGVAFFVTVIVVLVGIPFVRALARKWERQAAAGVPPEVERRLERIEQAVETIAVEVERIGEGQRFTNRVVAELRGLPAGDAAAAERALLERANAARERAR